VQRRRNGCFLRVSPILPRTGQVPGSARDRNEKEKKNKKRKKKERNRRKKRRANKQIREREKERERETARQAGRSAVPMNLVMAEKLPRLRPKTHRATAILPQHLRITRNCPLPPPLSLSLFLPVAGYHGNNGAVHCLRLDKEQGGG